MAPAAEAAIAEVSASGLLLDGTTVSAVRADTTCVDAAAATAAIDPLLCPPLKTVVCFSVQHLPMLVRVS